MNKTIIVIAMLASAFLTINCHKEEKDDSSTNFLLVYLLDQASGNCATITKSATGTTYSASASTVPKGGCNATTLQTGLYTTSPTEAKTAVDTGYDGIKTIFDAHSSCSTLAAATSVTKASVTTTTITTTQNAQTSGNTGCTAVGSGRIVSGKSSSVFICKDEASVTAVKALTGYHNVSDVKTDVATSLTALRLALTTAKATNGFSDAQILTLAPWSATDLAFFSSANWTAMQSSFSTSACLQAIIATDATAKPILASFFGKNTLIGTTDSDVSAVVTTKTSSATCGYGSAFVATTSNGSCPSTYPTF